VIPVIIDEKESSAIHHAKHGCGAALAERGRRRAEGRLTAGA
jgi:hypothetical protein